MNSIARTHSDQAAYVQTRPTQRPLTLNFQKAGRMEVVFHVYVRLHPDRISRRYTVEVGQSLIEDWSIRTDPDRYSLSVYDLNGVLREFRGLLHSAVHEVDLQHHIADIAVEITANAVGIRDQRVRSDWITLNHSRSPITCTIG